MSLFPFTGPIGIALAMLSIPIPVQDVVYSASGGADGQGTPISRTIQGAIDPSNARKMEYLFGGSVSDGDLLVFTSAALYIDDQYNPTSGQPRQQSFVTYQGWQYRVANMADWTQQAGMFVFLAHRHVAQNGGI